MEEQKQYKILLENATQQIINYKKEITELNIMLCFFCIEAVILLILLNKAL